MKEFFQSDVGTSFLFCIGMALIIFIPIMIAACVISKPKSDHKSNGGGGFVE